LRRPPEEWWGVTVGVGVDVGVDVRVLIGVLVFIMRMFSSQWCRGAGSGLLSGRSTLLPLAVSFAVLLLHRDLL
jgi:hypothetical protein